MSTNEEKITELQRQRDEEIAKIKKRVSRAHQVKKSIRHAESLLAERYKRMTGEEASDD